jgi:hypothetical protein
MIMTDMKTRLTDNLVIGIIIGAVSFLLLQYILIHVVHVPYGQYETPDYKSVGGNIDIEYYLEVSEDSIWVEGVQSKKVYSGTYSQLDSLILLDNK